MGSSDDGIGALIVLAIIIFVIYDMHYQGAKLLLFCDIIKKYYKFFCCNQQIPSLRPLNYLIQYP